mgnify:CR=1 FL=1
MKRIIVSLIMFSTVAAMAQNEVVQSGTPAVLEAPNGKKIRVFLQKLDGDNLTFQAYKSTKDITVPASKIKSLEFFAKYDAESVEMTYNQGDYDDTLSVLEPLMEDYLEYMPIQNNMRNVLAMFYDAYLRKDDFSNVRKLADILMACGDASFEVQAKVGLALAALAEEDFATAEQIRSELESPTASLYLEAVIERSQGNPKEALKTVADLIAEHGNDLEWLPDSELLAAYCYLDMTGTNSVITTNSAMYSARQVKNIYNGSPVAADAEKLWISLGGDVVEAEKAAKKAELAAVEAEIKARREAERQAEREAARAARAAEAAAVLETNTNTQTESE